MVLPESDLLHAQTIAPTPSDEEAVRNYVRTFDAAWNRHDAIGLFGKRAQEIDRINAFGGWIRDPRADERVMSRLFSGPFDRSKNRVTAERVRFLTSDVAIVIIHMVRLSVGPQAGPASKLGNRALHVLVKRHGHWELTAFANVPIIDPPNEIREAEGPDVLYGDPTP